MSASNDPFEDIDLEWPSKGDTLFGEATGPDGDWAYNACLMGPDPWMLARGYHDAAHHLFESIEATDARHLNDAVVLPILFLWRHFLELTLKTLLMDLMSYNRGGAGPIRATHRLDYIWRDVRKELVLFAGGKREPELEAIDAVIGEFMKHDPKGIDFRYATDISGNPTQKTLPRLINLKKLDHVMRGVANFLEGSCSMLDAAAENRREYEAYMNDFVPDLSEFVDGDYE